MGRERENKTYLKCFLTRLCSIYKALALNFFSIYLLFTLNGLTFTLKLQQVGDKFNRRW
jgi:hypothetical protein